MCDGWMPSLPSCDLTGEDYRILFAQQHCVLCRQRRTKDGHDPCIANLPGVDFACCGHGVGEAYVKLADGRVLRGEFDHVRGLVGDAIAREG